MDGMIRALLASMQHLKTSITVPGRLLHGPQKLIRLHMK
jgi:hypothetical protein